jgi:hypothetical protein
MNCGPGAPRGGATPHGLVLVTLETRRTLEQDITNQYQGNRPPKLNGRRTYENEGNNRIPQEHEYPSLKAKDTKGKGKGKDYHKDANQATCACAVVIETVC